MITALTPPDISADGTPIYSVSAYDPPRNVSFYVTNTGNPDSSHTDHALDLLRTALLADGYQSVTMTRHDETTTPL